MGQCLKICEGTFCIKMADSNAISSITLSILLENTVAYSKIISNSTKFHPWHSNILRQWH